MKRPRPSSTPPAPPAAVVSHTPPPPPAKRMQMKVPSSSSSPTDASIPSKMNSTADLTSLNLDEPIPLTPFEEELFDLLLQVIHQPLVPPVTLRVAGGWVRDKILFPGRDLGKEVDIDIALDTMLGNDFAELINAYMKSKGMQTGSVGLIQKNPDQSKHLETATMRVLGMWLDLVNLRTETYSHDSRIPDVQIGTPKEDALRRDLTINALFYNIGTKQLEDYTEKGFDDIRARIIRTPLPPLTTLLDDPLRALRAVRFAARLNFIIDEELSMACKNPAVHDALSKKVSRERISGELHHILADKFQNPPHAVALLVEFGLFPVVVRMPPSSSIIHGEKIKKAGLPPPLPGDMPMESLSALINLHSLDGECWGVETCASRPQLLRFAALLSPAAGLRCLHSDNGKRPKEMSVANYIMRVELRLGANDAAAVCSLLEGAREFRQLVHEGAGQLGDLERLRVANAMRSAGGKTWRGALRIALVMELPVVRPKESFAKVLDDCGGRIELGEGARIAIKEYEQFKKKVEDLGMEGVWDLKPAVNGNELNKVLPRLKKGPVMGKIMKQQVDWLVQNPGKGKDDVIQWIQTTYPEMA